LLNNDRDPPHGPEREREIDCALGELAKEELYQFFIIFSTLCCNTIGRWQDDESKTAF